MRAVHSKLALTITLTAVSLHAQAQALEGDKRCFLHGSIRSVVFTGGSPSSPANVGITDTIRLSFDADSQTYCQKMIASYCRYNVLAKQYVPHNMSAYFRDKKEAKVDFTIDGKCKVTASDASSAED